MSTSVKIVVQRADGGVSIMLLVLNDGHGIDREYSPDFATEQLAKVGLGGLPFRLVEDGDIPADRTFRDAWVDTGAAVEVDMVKAVEIHKDRLRKVRAPLLAQLDVDYLLADEADDKAAKQAIVAQKQALRDLTDDPIIAAATTPEELKLAIPEVLKSE